MMFANKCESTNKINALRGSNGDDFHRRVQAGLRQAPIERAKVIKGIWSAIFKK